MFNGKNVVVAGAGISGVSAADVLKDCGAKVTLYDAKSVDLLPQAVRRLIPEGIQLCFGGAEKINWQKYDLLILSPGISINSSLASEAKKQGIEVISEIEVAFRLCKAPIIAVTGTNGKTTTTSLIGEMLKTTVCDVVVGGNIGIALSHEVQRVNENGIVVAEISSFQLEGVRDFSPHIAAVLNITPDHLDRHGSFEEYKKMKERIFQQQSDQDILVLNYDDIIVREMAARTKSRVVYFSAKNVLSEGFFVVDNDMFIKINGVTEKICGISDMKIFGSHNIENALAACACAYFAEVSLADMAKVLAKFSGVEHRIELAATINGVNYYNDSKATNPESAIKALQAFPANIILIAGGRDKNTDLSEMMSLAKERVDHLILLGEARERFAQAAQISGLQNIHLVDDLYQAITLAHKIAHPPQVVLLSPACASYDMFRNFEERGKIFKETVAGLQ